MKTPDEALKQWVSDCIYFDGGDKCRYYKREELACLASAIRTNKNEVFMTSNTGDKDIVSRSVSISDLIDWANVHWLHKLPVYKLEPQFRFGIITAEWLLPFETFDEINQWFTDAVQKKFILQQSVLRDRPRFRK